VQLIAWLASPDGGRQPGAMVAIGFRGSSGLFGIAVASLIKNDYGKKTIDYYCSRRGPCIFFQEEQVFFN
jgi:hypothetical protein